MFVLRFISPSHGHASSPYMACVSHSPAKLLILQMHDLILMLLLPLRCMACHSYCCCCCCPSDTWLVLLTDVWLIFLTFVAYVCYTIPFLSACDLCFSCCSFLTDAALVFEVELISIGDAPPVVNVFKQIDGDADDHLSKEEVRAGPRLIEKERAGQSGALGVCPLLVAVTVAVASVFLAA